MSLALLAAAPVVHLASVAAVNSTVLADGTTPTDGGYSAADLGVTLLGAATTALPYIGAGVAAGATIMGISWGINKAIKHAKKVGNAA